ncbi:MAG: hypothetical protein J6V54_10700 [Bacteroidales bacterium]|nr:hypothetical protein [Bacteroidales bacterium]
MHDILIAIISSSAITGFLTFVLTLRSKRALASAQARLENAEAEHVELTNERDEIEVLKLAIAACREQVVALSDETKCIRQKYNDLLRDYETLQNKYRELKHKYDELKGNSNE